MSAGRSPFEVLEELCSAKVIVQGRRVKIQQAMLWMGVGSIRVGRRVFECPGPSSRLTIAVLPADPATVPASTI
ncbi:hypothetical protein [Nevskia sp.]|uniref:hypothetical protein n=1 Tax=Nevskia sp. TaxID=1929292 RepID=UPI0025E4DF11|nr:hypothetical protein [Nevskia sp.]